MPKIVDSDGDKLDDRLVSELEDVEDLDFYSLLDRVENVRIVGLPSKILEKMHEDIEKEQEIIKGKLAKLELFCMLISSKVMLLFMKMLGETVGNIQKCMRT